MKKQFTILVGIIIFVCVLLISTDSLAQGVAINSTGSAADNSSMLDVASTSKGILIPRMTKTQRNDISSPIKGLMIFQNDSISGYYYYNGASWEIISDGAFAINNLADGKTAGTSIFLGSGAGFNDNGTDYENVAVGDSALYNNGLGASFPGDATFNTAIGPKSLYSNTTGYQNTSIGAWSLLDNITGTDNVAIGNQSLQYNTTGHQNTAVGSFSLIGNESGYGNTAIGNASLYSNITGYNNTACGIQSLLNNTNGHHNTASGFQSLYSNTTGEKNVAIGDQSLYSFITGGMNTAIGYQSLFSNIGNQNTATGYQSLYSNTVGTANLADGYQALLSNTSGNFNTASGFGALNSNTTGGYNTATGISSLNFNTTGNSNTAVGREALYANKIGNNNTAVGYWAGPNTGTDNLSNTTALGNSAKPLADNQVRIGNSSVTSIGGYTSWTNLSDKRFKKYINNNIPGLDFILQLKPVSYQLDIEKLNDFIGIPDSLQNNEFDKRSAMEKEAIIQTGFIAQDVEKAAQSLGFDFSGVDTPKNKNDHYGLRYAEFVVPLVKAVQELAEINKAQNIIIEDLKTRIEEMGEK